jgi:glycosyltransferase involved in cell wall biosynthesis
MRICLFEHHNNPYPIQGYGGIERINQLLFLKLSELGYDVTLIVVDSSTIESKYPNQKIIKLPFHEIENIRYGRIPVSKYFNGDIFQTHTSSSKYCNFNFTDFNGKWIATCHGHIEWVGAKYQSFVSKNQYNQHIIHNLIESTTEKIFFTPGCVESEHFFYDINGTHNKLVWLGRICHDKGVDRLIEIAKNIDDDILVAGNIVENHLFNELMSCSNVKYCGYITTEEEKSKFFSNAKASLHTSNFEDPFPLTILEAQSCGIPVITWSNGSVRESNFSLKNVHDSLESVIDYLKSHNYLLLNNHEIENWVKSNFSSKNLAENYLNVYNQILNK